MVNADYKLWIHDQLRTGRTDAKGVLEVQIPVDAAEGRLTVADYTWPLKIGHLNPLEADSPDGGVSGVQGRLLNLGYLTGVADGALDEATKAAIKSFQTDHA